MQKSKKITYLLTGEVFKKTESLTTNRAVVIVEDAEIMFSGNLCIIATLREFSSYSFFLLIFLDSSLLKFDQFGAQNKKNNGNNRKERVKKTFKQILDLAEKNKFIKQIH